MNVAIVLFCRHGGNLVCGFLVDAEYPTSGGDAFGAIPEVGGADTQREPVSVLRLLVVHQRVDDLDWTEMQVTPQEFVRRHVVFTLMTEDLDEVLDGEWLLAWVGDMNVDVVAVVVAGLLKAPSLIGESGFFFGGGERLRLSQRRGSWKSQNACQYRVMEIVLISPAPKCQRMRLR